MPTYPTTEVADVGLRLALASKGMQKDITNILERILLRMRDKSMILMVPVWINLNIK
jgi:hypothetical protein